MNEAKNREASELPLISVIVPVYNAEKYIARCISSIQKQTYTNLEIVIVNDGSSDKSAEILEEIKSKDNRIMLYHRENGGSSAARNFGLEKANGAYVGFVDADDWVEETMYETMYQRMVSDSAQMVTCGEDRYYEETNTYEPAIVLEDAVFEGEEGQAKVVRNNAGPCNKLYSKEFISGIRYDEELNRSEDTKYIYDILKYNPRISTVKNIFYHYNYTVGSRDTRGFNSATWDVFKVVEYIYDTAMGQCRSLQLKDAVSERLVGGAYRVFLEIAKSKGEWTKEDKKQLRYICSKLHKEAMTVMKYLKVSLPTKLGIFVMVIFPRLYVTLLKLKNGLFK